MIQDTIPFRCSKLRSVKESTPSSTKSNKKKTKSRGNKDGLENVRPTEHTDRVTRSGKKTLSHNGSSNAGPPQTPSTRLALKLVDCGLSSPTSAHQSTPPRQLPGSTAECSPCQGAETAEQISSVVNHQRSPRKRLFSSGGDTLVAAPDVVDEPHSPTKRTKNVLQSRLTKQPPEESPQDVLIPEDNRTKLTPLRLKRQDGGWWNVIQSSQPERKLRCYQKVKQALHSSTPSKLLCREKERKSVVKFMEDHLASNQPGSLYISGGPGTGKTVSLMGILQEFEFEYECHKLFINCMALRNSQDIFNKIASEMSSKGQDFSRLTMNDAVKYCEKKVTQRGKMIVMVLDEIDQLDTKTQHVLYRIFEWTQLPKSRLILIGIANALDLTDRILPRLQANSSCQPELIHFKPYTRTQIAAVLQNRMEEASDGAEGGNEVLDNGAINFCARKVSAVAGDMRKALDICRRAVEIVESDVRKQQVLQPCNSALNSPTKCRPPAAGTPGRKVSIPQIASVISEVYSSRLVVASSAGSATGGESSIPLQQKLATCTLLLLLNNGSSKEIALGKLHDTYRKVCRQQHVPNVDQSEFHSLCTLLETRGMIAMKKAKEIRLTKITMKYEEKEVQYALQDKTLLASILSAGIPS